MEYRLERFEKHDDARGHLVVFLGCSELDESCKLFGQIYFVTFDGMGVIRGNHYHKKWREWFGVVSGRLQVLLKDVNTGETVELLLDGDAADYIRLEIGPYVAHAFKSVTPSATLLNYADSEWSQEDSIPYGLME